MHRPLHEQDALRPEHAGARHGGAGNPHSPDSRRIRIRSATGGPLLSRRTDAALHALRPRRRTERHASRSGVLLHRLRRRISGTVLNARRSPPKSAATLRAGKENRNAAHFFVRCQTKRRRTNHFVKPSAIEFTRIAEARKRREKINVSIPRLPTVRILRLGKMQPKFALALG